MLRIYSFYNLHCGPSKQLQGSNNLQKQEVGVITLREIIESISYWPKPLLDAEAKRSS